jgi:polyribonucleotide nucleotidyltransferase
VIRDDLQKVNNVQDVYAATLALKIFRMMMTFVVDFHFKIKQLNVVNVFLNVFNDEKIYCHISNEYKQLKKLEIASSIVQSKKIVSVVIANIDRQMY